MRSTGSMAHEAELKCPHTHLTQGCRAGIRVLGGTTGTKNIMPMSGCCSCSVWKLTEKSRQVCGLQQAPPRSCCTQQRGIKPRDPSFSWAHRASKAFSMKKEGVNPQGRAQGMPSPAIHLCHSAPTRAPGRNEVWELFPRSPRANASSWEKC